MAPTATKPSTDTAANDAEAAWLAEVAQRGSGSTGALTRLMNAYERRIRAFFLGRGAAFDDIEDMLQDVFTAVFAKAGEFRGGASSSWIWSIARNRWIDGLRDPARRRRVEVDLDDEAAQPVAPPDLRDTDDCVRRGLARFEQKHPDDADALLRRDLEGWDIPELARYLGRSEGATRVYLASVRKKVNPFLKPCFDMAEL